ncbi:MAG: class III signal peptide-containing protein [Candidatus Hadarchaeales archaeon]
MWGRKGQGAIEYLLILAAVLIVVAGAVYYVTRTGGFPTMSFTAALGSDNNITLTVGGPSGTIKDGDWEYRGKTATGTVVGAWMAGSGELSEGVTVVLPGLKTYVDAGQLGVGDKVQIRHKPSGHVYDVPIAQG